jgi:hypothetical protein
VTNPEEALELARRRAAEARAAGEYDDDLSGFAIEPTDRVSTELLLEWAVVEPELEHVRSTRPVVGPVITAFKRALVRANRQYLGQVVAQQNRFNLHLLVHVSELEDRVRRLEEWSSTRS